MGPEDENENWNELTWLRRQQVSLQQRELLTLRKYILKVTEKRGMNTSERSGYLDEIAEQTTAHVLLQDVLIIIVTVAATYQCREENHGQEWIAEVVEWQGAQLLKNGWVMP